MMRAIYVGSYKPLVGQTAIVRKGPKGRNGRYSVEAQFDNLELGKNFTYYWGIFSALEFVLIRSPFGVKYKTSALVLEQHGWDGGNLVKHIQVLEGKLEYPLNAGRRTWWQRLINC
jgi:hypothetical protein